MLAAIATAVPLPNLSLIALVTESQTSCLREEITTLAPCSAIRSAMARPMPRDEPVMTATFPDISNRLMRFPPRLAGGGRAGFIAVQLSSVRAGRQPNDGRDLRRACRGVRFPARPAGASRCARHPPSTAAD